MVFEMLYMYNLQSGLEILFQIVSSSNNGKVDIKIYTGNP